VDRRYICTLYDESRPVLERLKIAYGLLARPDALTFIPTLQIFLSRHPPDRFSAPERSIFAAIQGLDTTRDAVLQLARRLNVSAMKLELAHFAMLVGWLDRAEFHALAVDGAGQLLHQRLTAEVVDIMCAITKLEPLRDDFSADDIPTHIYHDSQGLRLLSCLAPTDPRVSPRVIPALRSKDPEMREWAAYTLTQLRPCADNVLGTVAPYLRDPSPAIAENIRWLLQEQGIASAPCSEDDRAGRWRRVTAAHPYPCGVQDWPGTATSTPAQRRDVVNRGNGTARVRRRVARPRGAGVEAQAPSRRSPQL
jgi:hypothetical protein